MTLSSILWNQNGRLRSGWRATIFLSAFILVSIVIGSILQALAVVYPGELAPGTAGSMLLYGLVSLIPVLIVGWLCGKFLEGLPFKALGAAFANRWARHLGAGLLIGALTLGLAVGIAMIFGGLSFDLDSQSSEAIGRTMGLSLVIFAVAAAFEEALFRGYILQTFTRAGLAWLAIALTSIFFGMVHLGNPGANLISSLNTALAGIWFGVAYLKTRDLWFPFGIHLAWNWMQGAFFGIEVSGLTEITSAPLLKEIDRGPAWLTGEAYGVEAGIVCTAAIIVSIVVIMLVPGLKPTDEMAELTSDSPRVA
jgi:membrane protease YdiL (CAAX protease family)